MTPSGRSRATLFSSSGRARARKPRPRRWPPRLTSPSTPGFGERADKIDRHLVEKQHDFLIWDCFDNSKWGSPPDEANRLATVKLLKPLGEKKCNSSQLTPPWNWNRDRLIIALIFFSSPSSLNLDFRVYSILLLYTSSLVTKNIEETNNGRRLKKELRSRCEQALHFKNQTLSGC